MTNQTIEVLDYLTAEKAAIGYLVLVEKFSALTSKLENIDSKIFRNKKTAGLFQRILELGSENKPFDIDSLLVDEKVIELEVDEDYIVECGKLMGYLDLENDVFPTLNRMAQVSKIEKKLYSTTIDPIVPEVAIGVLREIIDDFDCINQDKQVHYLSDIAENLRNKKPDLPIRIPYMPILESHFKGGFKRGGTYVLLAPPGFGKTQCAVTIAEESAKPFYLMADRVTQIPMNYKVLFLSLEMDKEDLYWRILSKMSGVPVDYLEGIVNVPESQREIVEQTRVNAQKIFTEQYHIKITDDISDYDELVALIEKQCKMNACDILIIDYLGLVTSEDPKIPDWFPPQKFAKKMMQLAKQYKFANIQLSQFKSTDSKFSGEEPAWFGQKTLDDIEGGKKIGQSATGVIYLYQTKEQKEKEKLEKCYYKTKIMYKLLKNRKGRMIRDVILDFNRSTSSIKEAPENFANQDLRI